MKRLADIYANRLTTGIIRPDPAQAKAITALNDVSERLAKSKGGFLRKPAPVRGLYIWGDVGRGKSMLMDLFFEHAPVKLKSRVHFHAFMQDVQGFLTYWRGLEPKERRRSQWHVKGAGDDPIPAAAAKIAATGRLICFDEFQVTQIADAMILSRLFEALFARGVTMVSTSNRPPNDLYKDGLNRKRFLPFIDLLEDNCDVLKLAAERDYRLERISSAPVWYAPLGQESDTAMDRAWKDLTRGADLTPTRIHVSGRTIEVPNHAAGFARFDFEDLCARPLGAADYLALAARFHTLLIDHIPALTPERKNEAIRFITLIDTLYEAKTNLVASAAVDPEYLYTEGDGHFEFQRTVSRLHEMRSSEYIAAERMLLAVDSP